MAQSARKSPKLKKRSPTPHEVDHLIIEEVVTTTSVEEVVWAVEEQIKGQMCTEFKEILKERRQEETKILSLFYAEKNKKWEKSGIKISNKGK